MSDRTGKETDPNWRATPWQGRYKIPWNDPEFSRRMLAEHLSQNHDLASRRNEWIDRQVAWIHERFLSEGTVNLLDLACGPGFYSHRLSQLGHSCHGMDFGPASIEYAREHCPACVDCRFTHGDIRSIDPGGGYTFAMLIYGELNVFSPEECIDILRRMRGALSRGGRFVIEMQSPEVVRSLGIAEDSEFANDSGLFSDHPHRCRIRNHWLDELRVSVQEFSVVETETGNEHYFRSTTRAWEEDEFRSMLFEAGFDAIAIHPDWPQENANMILWSGEVRA